MGGCHGRNEPAAHWRDRARPRNRRFRESALRGQWFGHRPLYACKGAVEVQRDLNSSGVKRAVIIDLPAESLQVFRDRYTHYDLVGKLTVRPDGRMQFSYDSKYLEGPSSTAISVSMPMRPEPYSSRTASSFFDALLPEEGRRTALESMLHVDKHDPVGLLSKLNNETIGALVFETGEESPGSREDYLPVSEELFDALALHPGRVSARQNSATRLSLSGGMSKLRLYQD